MGFCDEGVSPLADLCSLKPNSELKLSVVTTGDDHFLEQGKCMKQVQDVIERLWDFIDKLDINTFGELFNPNNQFA